MNVPPFSFVCSGHTAVNMRMKAKYRVAGYVDEMMGGITQLETIPELLKQAEEDWPSLLARLEKMRSTLLTESTCRDGMFLDITGDKAVLEKVQPAVNTFLNELPGASNAEKLPNFYKEKHPWVAPIKELMTANVPVADEGFVVPTQVSYVGKGGLLYSEGETASGSAQVVARFLRTGVSSDRELLPCRKFNFPGNRIAHHFCFLLAYRSTFGITSE
jgi:Zn-dependent M16 (insulinase) family peptidase